MKNYYTFNLNKAGDAQMELIEKLLEFAGASQYKLSLDSVIDKKYITKYYRGGDPLILVVRKTFLDEADGFNMDIIYGFWELVKYIEKMNAFEFNMDIEDYRFFITEIDLQNDCMHVGYYLLPKTDNYREKVSCDAFFERRYKSKKFLYHREWIDDILELEAVGALFMKEKLDIAKSDKVIKCENIFDFYNKIGYAYKNKRYIK